MITVDIGDVRLRVLDQGQGPVVLLIHGFPLDHRMWSHQIKHLSRRYRVVAPDLRGFGGSDVSPGTVSMKDFAHDIAALLDRMKIDEPVHFCGLSMGGYIAWQFWDQYSSRLRSLLLCDTRAVADSAEVACGRLMMAQSVERQGMSGVADALIPKLLCEISRENKPEIADSLRAVIDAMDPRGVAAAQKGMAERPDFSPRLTEIESPALVLCGAEDAISGPEEMGQIAQQLGNARYVEIQNAGHMSPLEQPELVNRALEEFLDGVG